MHRSCRRTALSLLMVMSIALFIPGVAQAAIIKPGVKVILPTATGMKTISLAGKTPGEAKAKLKTYTLKRTPASISVKNRGYYYSIKTSDLELKPDITLIARQASTVATDTVIAVNYVNRPAQKKIRARVERLAAKLKIGARTVTASGGARLANFGGQVIHKGATTTSIIKSLKMYGKTKAKAPKTISATRRVSKPTVSRNSGYLVVVSRIQRMVYVIKGTKVIGTYPIAVGSAGYSTPTGNYYIGRKAVNPVWRNPGSSWATGMPSTLAGPFSPLGVRALYLYRYGRDTLLRFHGTTAEYTVGSASSHGCMRMIRADVVRMHEQVPVGTRVTIAR